MGSRLFETNLSLRRAMVTVLGPHACNEGKFTPWFSEGKALGLLWNLPQMSLSMPEDKIEKARSRIMAVLNAEMTTKSSLNKLLGSLRHVATCVRAAPPFFQQLASLQRSAHPSYRFSLTREARDDLKWFLLILCVARLNAIHLQRFVDVHPPEVASPRKASYVAVRLRGAKNNQYGREDIRYQQKTGDSIICPVKGAKGAEAFGTEFGQPALATGPRGGVQSKEVAQSIKKAANVRRVSCADGLRISRPLATDVSVAHQSPRQIQEEQAATIFKWGSATPRPS